ncbi:tripartite motif-containing protein 3-like [Acanthaster planci]|uniref:Tripartite motif-containing protein 3-like n=1 Tax=Acanthaster planci TaxID=133434 RepID=A0A8B7Z6U0_ACAPL|nr:tripartite motif-containing protein 3-like [Acanthaster planci]
MAQRSLLGMTREVLGELVTCGICFEKYDERTKQAKVLPCFHGFCAECLGKLVRGNSQLQCPVCRREAPVPEGSVQGLPDNFIAKNLKELEHILGRDETTASSLRCGSCRVGGGYAVSFCSHDECVTFLCQSCDQAHHTMLKFDGHVVNSLQELQERPGILLLRPKLHCQQHKHSLSVFCAEERCQQPICLVCATTAHTGHNIISLDQKESEAKEELQNLTQMVQNQTSTVKEILTKIDSEINNTQNRKVEMSSDISRIFRNLQEQLQSRHDDVIADLEKQSEERIEQLHQQAENAELFVSQLETVSLFAERTCEIGNAVELLQTREQIIPRLHELIDHDIDASVAFQPASKTFLSLTRDHDETLKVVEGLLPELGQFHKVVAEVKPTVPDDQVSSDITWNDAFVRCEHTIVIRFEGCENCLPCLKDLQALYSVLDDTSSPETEAEIKKTDDRKTFRIVYTPPTAGQITMAVLFNSKPIPNSPFTINVNPLHPGSTTLSTPDLGRCPPNTAVLDMPYTLTILTFDGSGERVTTGGYEITAFITTASSEQPHSVTDNQDGSYKVTVIPRSTEMHFVQRIGICGYPVIQAPLKISVRDSLPFEDPPGGYKKPSGIGVDNKSESVFVVDTRQDGKIYIFDSEDGSYVSEHELEKYLHRKSSQIAVDHSGKLVLLVSDLKTVFYSYKGCITHKWKCIYDNEKPANLALSKLGHVIIGDSKSHELFIYHSRGVVLRRIQLPKGSLAMGINNVCVDCNQSILVATHSKPNQILRYTVGGRETARLVSPAQTDQLAVAATPEGALIVSVLRGILVMEFGSKEGDVAVVKEFQTDHIFTQLAVVTDGCFVAFDPGEQHLAKYNYLYIPERADAKKQHGEKTSNSKP